MSTSYQLLCDLEIAIRNEHPFPRGRKPDVSYTAIRAALMAWPCARCGHAKYQHPIRSTPECRVFAPTVGVVPVKPTVKETVASKVDEMLSNGIKLFFVTSPQFNGLGTAKKVAQELEKLVDGRVLKPRVQIRSSIGHVCWEGSREQFSKIESFTCEDSTCEETIDDPKEHAVEFYVWRG